MRSIIIETKHQEPDAYHAEGVAAGQQFEVDSLAVAKRYYPGALILRYANGDAWDGPKRASKEDEDAFKAAKSDAKTEAKQDAADDKQSPTGPQDAPQTVTVKP